MFNYYLNVLIFIISENYREDYSLSVEQCDVEDNIFIIIIKQRRESSRRRRSTDNITHRIVRLVTLNPYS